MIRLLAKKLGTTLPVVAVLLLLLLLLGMAYALAGLRNSERWLRHANEVRLDLANLQAALIDAETGQRGFLATGDSTFLEPYRHALDVWHPSFDRVRELTQDNPRQAQRLAEVSTLIEQKFDDLKDGIEARDRGITGVALVPMLAQGKRSMDAIRRALEEMEREEEALDDQRARESVRQEQVLFVLLFAAGACLMLVGASAWTTRNRQHHLAVENAALEAKAGAERALSARREFLAKAGAALASSLDYRTTLGTVAHLAVPELADWCSVELIKPGAALAQLAVVHVDPNRIKFVRELGERYPPDPNALTGAPQVVRTGKAELYAEIPAELLEAAAKDSEHLRIIRELRLESAMIVPLTGRDRVLGAVSFVYAESKRRYTESDLAFAEDFARRAAMAIENSEAHTALGRTLEFQERFAAVLGHDLRNPLAAIDMASGILAQRAKEANDATSSRILARIESSSRRMSRMIEQILDLTRSRLGGGLEMRPSSMDLCPMLTGIVNELRIAHPGRPIHLRCPPSMLGSWDRDRLEQVFSNLVSNAIHHGDAEKPISIEVRPQGDGLRVDVHNEGPPIPEELRAELFSPFRRGSKDSRTARTAGLGLGLFISREIVVAHAGTLEAQSSSAEGTTFQVTLPRAAPSPTMVEERSR